MTSLLTTEFADLRSGVREIALSLGQEYWRECDVARTYLTEFVGALTKAGWLSVLIPEEYGGGGRGISAEWLIHGLRSLA